MRVSGKEFKINRYASNTPTFRKKREEKCGVECVNCGSKENIEYHHIVPVIYGGTNKTTNIVPLCVDCHYKAHQKTNAIGIKMAKEEGRIGRKKIKTYEEAKPMLKKYFDLEIGNKELHTALGFSPTNHSSVYDIKNQYKKEFGIDESFRNTIDIKNAASIRSSKKGRG